MSRRRVSEDVRRERRNELKKTLKSMIFPVVLLAIMAIGVYAIILLQKPVPEEPLIVPNSYAGDTDPIICENDALKLTLDPTTTQFTVEVKATGKVWRSNPEGASSDPIALHDEKGKLQSTLIMSYATQTGLEVVYDSYSFSAENGIYTIDKGDNWVQVNYSIGKIEKEYFIPPILMVEEFEEWMAKLDEKTATLARDYFKKYDKNKLSKADKKIENELLEQYPMMNDHIIYVLRDTTKEETRKILQAGFAEAGYTYEQYLEDKELVSSETAADKAVFNIPIRYTLEGDELVVTVPLTETEYLKSYQLYTISMLPYFGAGSKADEGFVFVPEGGGAIINFNNEKTAQSDYYSNFYGWDMCQRRVDKVHETDVYFPVYGVSNPDGSYICIVEKGAPYAGVQSSISGKKTSYNYVNSVYTVAPREKYDVGQIANSDIYEYAPHLPEETLQQRYRFIDSSDYVDMAKNYGSYLKREYGNYLTLNNDSSAPIVVDIIGAVDKVKQIVGIPASRPLELTNFDEAGQMVKELSDKGLKNLSVKMLGWCNGGVYQKYMNRIKVLSDLGGKKGLKNFVETAKSAGAEVYLNGVTQYAYDSDLFDGFFSYSDAAKTISKKRAELTVFSSVTYAARDGAANYYLVHASKALEFMQKLVDFANEYGVGVAYEDAGKDVSSDFYTKDYYTRDNVRELQEEKFKAIDDAGTKVMINMGNDYAAPFVDMVTDMDLTGSDYTILDYNVPFYQIALHGYVNYTGEALNICGNLEDELLACAEYGAGLHFALMKESAFTLQDSLYTKYYGCDYDVWGSKVVEIYTRYNNELGHVFNQEMVDHDQLEGEVSCTMYADGTKVYVNYSYADYTTEDGVKVPARDYKVVR